MIDRTCTDTSAGFYWNAIGVQLLWLDTPGVLFAAAKKLTRDRRLTCDYDAIACSDADERAAWARLINKTTNYYSVSRPQPTLRLRVLSTPPSLFERADPERIE